MKSKDLVRFYWRFPTSLFHNLFYFFLIMGLTLLVFRVLYNRFDEHGVYLGILNMLMFIPIGLCMNYLKRPILTELIIFALWQLVAVVDLSIHPMVGSAIGLASMGTSVPGWWLGLAFRPYFMLLLDNLSSVRSNMFGDFEVLCWSVKGLRECPQVSSLVELVDTLDGDSLAYFRAIKGKTAIEVGGGHKGRLLFYYTENYPKKKAWKIYIRVSNVTKKHFNDWAENVSLPYGRARVMKVMTCSKSQIRGFAEEFEIKGRIDVRGKNFVGGDKITRLRPPYMFQPPLENDVMKSEFTSTGQQKKNTLCKTLGNDYDITLWSEVGKTELPKVDSAKLIELLDGKNFSFMRCIKDEVCCEIACDRQGNYVVYYSENYLDDTWNIAQIPSTKNTHASRGTEIVANDFVWHVPPKLCITFAYAQKLFTNFLEHGMINMTSGCWLSGKDAQEMHIVP